MKKRKLLIIVACIVLLFGLCMRAYDSIFAGLARYETPEESFQKSSPHAAVLIDIIEDKDVAYIVYRHNNTINYDSIITKDILGWSSVAYDIPETKSITFENGNISLWSIQEKTIIKIVVVEKENMGECLITDSLGSSFLMGSVATDNSMVYYGLLVLESQIPDDYSIAIGNEIIELKG